MVLIYPTFANNKTYNGFAHFCHWLPAGGGRALAETQQPFFQATNALVVLDDCAASNDMKGRTGQLVSLGFSARHAGISVWVLTQQIISIAKPFRENVAAIVLQTGWTKHHVPVRGGGLGGQRAKKVVSDSPGLVDFVIGLVNSVINLADGQVTFFWERRTVKSIYSSKRFWG